MIRATYLILFLLKREVMEVGGEEEDTTNINIYEYDISKNVNNWRIISEGVEHLSASCT